MFIISNFNIYTSYVYPKYLILNAYIINNDFILKDFYYIIAKSMYASVKRFPTYLIISSFYFDIDTKKFDIDTKKGAEKFNLSKLGTDYLINRIGMHYQYECKGSYPENYVFVIEPMIPSEEKVKTDMSSVKGFH